LQPLRGQFTVPRGTGHNCSGISGLYIARKLMEARRGEHGHERAVGDVDGISRLFLS